MRVNSMRASSILLAIAASVIAVPVAEPQLVTLSVLTTNTVGSTVSVPLTTLLATSTTSAKTSSTSSKTSTSTTSKSTTSTSKRTTSSTSKRTTSTTSKRTTSTTSRKTTSTTSTKTTSSTSTKATSSSITTVKPTTSSTIAGTPIAQSRTGTLAAGATPTTFQQIALYHHNIHRANHSAQDLAWSDNLAMIAANIASSCVYAHNTAAGGGGYGQNIAAGVQANNVSRVITDLFYNGEVAFYNGLYGAPTPDFTNFARWGHFSQIVWKQTSMVGCAVQYCPGGLANTPSNVAPYFTVCNYGPPGNYLGEFGDNVGEPLGQATASWNTGLDISLNLGVNI